MTRCFDLPHALPLDTLLVNDAPKPKGKKKDKTHGRGERCSWNSGTKKSLGHHMEEGGDVAGGLPSCSVVVLLHRQWGVREQTSFLAGEGWHPGWAWLGCSWFMLVQHCTHMLYPCALWWGCHQASSWHMCQVCLIDLIENLHSYRGGIALVQPSFW